MSSWMWFTGCDRSLQSFWVWSGEWHRWKASWESPCECPAHSRRCRISLNKSNLSSSSPRQILHHQRRRAVRVLQQLPADRWGRLRWHVGTHQGRLHDLFCSLPGRCCHVVTYWSCLCWRSSWTLPVASGFSLQLNLNVSHNAPEACVWHARMLTWTLGPS